MTNKYGVSYLTVGELREALKDIPDEAAIGAGYLSDHAGFLNCYTTSFVKQFEFHDYGMDNQQEHIGYEFRLETASAAESGDPLK